MFAIRLFSQCKPDGERRLRKTRTPAVCLPPRRAPEGQEKARGCKAGFPGPYTVRKRRRQSYKGARTLWGADCFVVPEYSFVVKENNKIRQFP